MRSAWIALVFLVSTIALGQGGPPYPYSGSLAWTLSSTPVCGTSPCVASQNLYRAVYTGTACGGFTKLQNVAPAVVSFSDSTVANDTSYCYGVTAVGSQGKESTMDLAGDNPQAMPPAPPTGLNTTVAIKNGKEDVVVAWTNPPTTKTNDLYVGVRSGGPYNTRHLHFPVPTTRWEDTNTPPGTFFLVATDTDANGQSGLSAQTRVVVP